MGIAHMRERTPEERQAALESAHKARAEKIAFNKANEHLLKLNYLDSSHWQELASKYRVRMPTYNVPADASGIRKMMRKCGVDNETFKEHYTSVDYFVDNNPKWTLVAVTGILLEIREGMWLLLKS